MRTKKTAKALGNHRGIPSYPDSDPRHHAAKIQRMLNDVIDHLGDDAAKFDQPKALALFETAAEVLIGLRTAFEHYESSSDEAFRE